MLQGHKWKCGLLVLAVVLAGCGRDTVAATATVVPPVKQRFPRPEHVRGIYLTAWNAGLTSKLAEICGLLDRTELNAVVIDVRDAGHNYWKGMNLPLSDESGATNIAIVSPKTVMDQLAARGVYPIARIACFRDRFVPVKHPELAVTHSRGGVWKDRSGYAWLDPYNRKNWEYIAGVVDFALNQGFPEIQLDYVRFPSEGSVETMVFPARESYGDAKDEPTMVVAAFARYIRERVKKRGAVLSADIFGIVSINKSDHGVGQELDQVSAPFDLMSPMVYPSHFHRGEYGVKNPSAQPYEIVSHSLRDYARRMPGKTIRPWLQDFWGYNKAQIQAQIQAAKDAGYEEYLIWNAKNHYLEDAYVDNSKLTAHRTEPSGVSHPN